MGHQSYAIPYATQEDLEKILDVIKLHNSWPSGHTDEFVRYSADQEYKHLEVGEELCGLGTASFRKNQAYKCPRRGPCLPHVVLVGNGGGRTCTFDFFRWHLMRAFPDTYVNCIHAVDAYSYDEPLENKLLKSSRVRLDDARIGVVPDGQYTDEMREANLAAAYTPVPAKYSTRSSGGVSAAWTALNDELRTLPDAAARKKRRLENPTVSPYSNAFETTVNGWVVQGQHFVDKEMAEKWAKREAARPGFDLQGSIDEMRQEEAKRNLKRFFQMRALGKNYWKRGGGGLFWLDDEELAERRASGETFEAAKIDYEPEGYVYGTPYSKASIEEIEGMINACDPIKLRNV